MSNLIEKLKRLKKRAKEHIEKSRDKQKKKWEEKAAERKRGGLRRQDKKSTKKGAQKGAFGKSPIVDPSPALKPAEMRERYKKEEHNNGKNKVASE